MSSRNCPLRRRNPFRAVVLPHAALPSSAALGTARRALISSGEHWTTPPETPEKDTRDAPSAINNPGPISQPDRRYEMPNKALVPFYADRSKWSLLDHPANGATIITRLIRPASANRRRVRTTPNPIGPRRPEQRCRSGDSGICARTLLRCSADAGKAPRSRTAFSVRARQVTFEPRCRRCTSHASTALRDTGVQTVVLP